MAIKWRSNYKIQSLPTRNPSFQQIILSGSGAAAAQAYKDKVKSYATSALLAYFPMDEAVGTSRMVNYQGTSSMDIVNGWTQTDASPGSGTFVDGGKAVFIASGGAGPRTGGAVNYYSADLFNYFDASGGNFTMMWWFRPNTNSMWSDSAGQRNLFTFDGGVGHQMLVKKQSGIASRVDFSATINGTAKTITLNSATGSGWKHYAMTFDQTGDTYAAYYNGSPVDTVEHLGSWNGNAPSPSYFLLPGGFYAEPETNTTFPGQVAHLAIWTVSLDATTISELATV